MRILIATLVSGMLSYYRDKICLTEVFVVTPRPKPSGISWWGKSDVVKAWNHFFDAPAFNNYGLRPKAGLSS